MTFSGYPPQTSPTSGRWGREVTTGGPDASDCWDGVALWLVPIVWLGPAPWKTELCLTGVGTGSVLIDETVVDIRAGEEELTAVDLSWDGV